jgi:hypothetical protein
MRLGSYLKSIITTIATTGALQAGCGYDGIWDINFGYRHDSLNWSIAGQSGIPNVYAELDWDDIHCFQVGTKYILAGWDSIYLRMEGYFGWIVQATPEYSVYFGNNRTDLYSREHGCRSGDKVFGGKGGMGFHLLRYHGPFDIALLGGYSFQEQRIRFRDMKLVFNQVVTPGIVTQLIGKYRPKWYSGWVGIDGSFRYRNCVTIIGGYEVHWAAYRAHGVWNWTEPRDQQIIFGNYTYYRQQWRDCSTAWGHVFNIEATYHTSENWNIGVFAYGQYFKTRPCTYDVTNFDDNSNPDLVYVVTFPNNTDNLNGIRWMSYYVGFNLQCQF